MAGCLIAKVHTEKQTIMRLSKARGAIMMVMKGKWGDLFRRCTGANLPCNSTSRSVTAAWVLAASLVSTTLLLLSSEPCLMASSACKNQPTKPKTHSDVFQTGAWVLVSLMNTSIFLLKKKTKKQLHRKFYPKACLENLWKSLHHFPSLIIIAFTLQGYLPLIEHRQHWTTLQTNSMSKLSPTFICHHLWQLHEEELSKSY